MTANKKIPISKGQKMITCGIFKKYIMYLVPVPSFNSL